MSRSISQVPTLRRLRRVYLRMLALAVPAVLVACQGDVDPLAPDTVGEPSVPAEAPATEQAESSPDLLAVLATNRIAFAGYTSDGGTDIWTMDPQGGTSRTSPRSPVPRPTRAGRTTASTSPSRAVATDTATST